MSPGNTFLLRLKMLVALILVLFFLLFLLPHLTLVMKSGLLCFSHYLFIKDMTRKWELPWRQLHKVSELYAELHCLLFCQERGAEWGAGGVFFLSFLFFLSRSLLRTFVPLCFLCGSNNDRSAVVILGLFSSRRNVSLARGLKNDNDD